MPVNKPSALSKLPAARFPTNARGTARLTQIPPTGLSKAQLISKILEVANANANATDPARLSAVREKLNPLVADLARVYGKPPVSEELTRGLTKTWKQVWSDDVRPSPPGAPQQDPKSALQKITADGYFYNFANVVVPTPPGAPSVKMGSFVRGTYSVDAKDPHQLNIEFTGLGALPGGLPPASEVGQLVRGLEDGTIKPASGRPPGAGGPPAGAGGPPAGAGPVGVKGKLSNLFLSPELRVVVGGTEGQQYNKLYVLIPE